MTHRPYTPQQSRSTHHSSHEASLPAKRSHTQPTSHIKPAEMVQSHLVLHIIQILGVFVCAHHLWPKGVTYGEAEDWEVKHRKKQAHGPRSKSKSTKSGSPSQGGSSNEGVRRSKSKREERVRDYEYEFEERPRAYDDRSRSYEERPRPSRKASSRY